MCGMFPHIFSPSVKQLKQLNAALVVSSHLLSKEAKDAQRTSCVRPAVTGPLPMPQPARDQAGAWAVFGSRWHKAFLLGCLQHHHSHTASSLGHNDQERSTEGVTATQIAATEQKTSRPEEQVGALLSFLPRFLAAQPHVLVTPAHLAI